MKFIELLQGRMEGQDKYTFNIHNPFWLLVGFIAGLSIGIGSTRAYYAIERLIGQ